QRGHQTPELFLCDFDGCGLRSHPLLVQNGGPTADWLCQSHHRRKLPPKGDWLLPFWQIMHVLCRAIGRRHGSRTCNLTCINANPEPLARIRLGQGVGKDFSQGLCINTPTFTCRSNQSDCDTSGNDLAWVSVIRASTVLNRASFPCRKLSDRS